MSRVPRSRCPQGTCGAQVGVAARELTPPRRWRRLPRPLALTPHPPPLTESRPRRRHRMPLEQWWLNLRLMLKMLAHYRISMADYVSGELEHVTRSTLSIETGF